MNKTKIWIILVLMIIFLLSINSTTLAFSVEDMGGTQIKQGNKIDKLGQEVVNILSIIASICSVIVLVVIGIKYMLGSTEEKANYKKSLLPYMIGAFFVFAASGIASIIYNIAIKL